MKTKTTIAVKTVKEMASCMTFNWIRLNGPPLIIDPSLLAGTIKEYSNKAIPHDRRITKIKGQSLNEGIICASLS